MREKNANGTSAAGVECDWSARCIRCCDCCTLRRTCCLTTGGDADSSTQIYRMRSYRRWQKALWRISSGLVCLVCTTALAAEGSSWLDDYGQAMKEAKQSKRMMLVYFHKDGVDVEKDAFVPETGAGRRIAALGGEACAGAGAVSKRSQVNGQEIQLIRHPVVCRTAGASGGGRHRFRGSESEYYGHVVSIYPLSLPGALTTKHLTALLSLPHGSLTQRTLILAVRIHPEGPASTDGTMLTTLAKESESHSRYQARITNQGHHNWESRFHRISGQLPEGLSGPGSVCRELAGRGVDCCGHRCCAELAAVVRALECRARTAPVLRLRHEARSQRYLVRHRHLLDALKLPVAGPAMAQLIGNTLHNPSKLGSFTAVPSYRPVITGRRGRLPVATVCPSRSSTAIVAAQPLRPQQS